MFRKPKTLKDQLLLMKVGEKVVISTWTYKVTSIRVVVSRLRKEGHGFIVTERGCRNCCEVTRTK